MDVIRQQFERIQQQLAALSASQKMLATSLVAIMVMTLIWWAKFAGTAEMVPVMSMPISGDEMAAIQTRLTAASVPNTVSGASILVPADRKVQAIALLASDKMLPRDGKGGFEDIIARLSPFDSEATKQKMWNVGLQQNLEQIICAMPGIDACRVFIDPTSRERIEGGVKPSASVSVRMRPPQKGDRKLAESIGYLVSGSNAALSKGRVNVVIDLKPYPLLDRTEDPLAASGDINEAQAAEEARHEQKIAKALSNYGDVVATVRVKIDAVSRRKTEKSYPEIKSKEVMSESTNTETSNPTPGGAEVGVGANTGASLTLGSSTPANATSTEEHVKSTMQNFAAETIEDTSKPGGEATVLSAAVHVPRGYFVSILKGTAPDAKDPDDKAVEQLIEARKPDIRKTVMTATGLKDETAVFVDASPDAPPVMSAMALEPASGSVTQSVKSHAREIALGILALLSLFMVSSMVKKGAPAPAIAMPSDVHETPRLAFGEEIAGEVGEGNAMLDGMELDDDSIKAQQMVEQVSTMVKENPDAAANLVKRWLHRS